MDYNPVDCGKKDDSKIKRWLVDHEELEDEMGIVAPQEDLPHAHEGEDEEETELVYHFR